MESIRQRQVAELIRRNFSQILQLQGSYVYGNALVTVTNVVTSPDLRQAKLYLSVYNAESKEKVLEAMDAELPHLNHELNKRLRRHVRRVPSISFFLDDTLDEMYRLNSLFDDLHEENQMGKEEE